MLKHLFVMLTGVDGESLDVGRVLLVLSVLTGMFLATFAVVVKGAVFDVQQFGIGMGTLLAGGGGMLFLKKNTEPAEKNVESGDKP